MPFEPPDPGIVYVKALLALLRAQATAAKLLGDEYAALTGKPSAAIADVAAQIGTSIARLEQETGGSSPASGR